MMKLDRPTMRDGGRLWLADFLAGLDSPGLERLRLDRLNELRAVIDSLRSAHEPEPPLESCLASERYHT
jgi:hypothetical protein